MSFAFFSNSGKSSAETRVRERIQYLDPTFLRGFLWRFLPAVLVIVAVLGYVSWIRKESHQTLLRQTAERIVAAQADIIEADLREIRSDLGILAHGNALQAFLAHGTVSIRTVLQQHFALLAQWKGRYDQIRYIDSAGMEAIRIDYREGKAVVVANSALQNKSSRRYFRVGITLDAGEIHVSPMELNSEHGVVEQPPKPVIRFIAPVFDVKGKRRGLIVLNYIADYLLTDFRRAATATGVPLLLNAAGYWLVAQDSADEWGFMFPGRRGRSFAQRHPEAWSRIRAATQGRFELPVGSYTFNTVAYRRRQSLDADHFLGASELSSADDNDKEIWKIVFFRPRSVIEAFSGIPWLIPAMMVTLAVAAILSWLLARETHQRALVIRALVASENQLREQLTFSRTLLESLPIPAFSKGKNGRYLGCNQAFAAFMGRSPEEIIGKTTFDVAPAQLAQAQWCMEQTLFADNAIQSYETQVAHADGSWRDVIMSKSPLLHEDGSPEGLIGAFVDITERKCAEAALQRASEYLDKILNTIPNPIFVKNRRHQWVFLNDAFCQFFGQSREVMLDKSDYDFFPKHEADVFYEKDSLVFKAWTPHLNEEAFTDHQGAQHTILTKKAVFQNAQAEDVLVGVITDITELKRAEQELRLAAEVFEHSAEGLFITDQDSIILKVNPAFTEITGYEANEAIGKNADFLSAGQQDEDFYANIWRSIEEQQHWRGEIANRRKDGEIFAVWLTVSTVRGSDDRIQRHVAIFSDISERKAAEQRMIYLAQHDFLTGLANRGLLQDRIEQALQRARRDAKRVALLLLDLDRFKQVNDTLGHDIGDRLLKRVAQRLLECVRQTDTVARLGGDEFVVLLPDLKPPSHVERVARQIIAEISRPFLLGGHDVEIGASVGIALFPEDGEHPDALSKAADAAMYRVKQSGRNHYAFFSSSAASL